MTKATKTGIFVLWTSTFRKVIMKRYKVRITALVETTNIVEADSKEEACLLAENDWAETFVVLNTYSNEPSGFSDIIGYEPEEIK